MTELLDQSPTIKVLEIGTGSGYQAALLASMGCAVFTIERIAALALTAKTVFDKLEVSNKINLRIGDGRLGWPEEAPFDCIIVTAAAPKNRGGLDQAARRRRQAGGTACSFRLTLNNWSK